jgi:hypothetical protein
LVNLFIWVWNIEMWGSKYIWIVQTFFSTIWIVLCHIVWMNILINFLQSSSKYCTNRSLKSQTCSKICSWKLFWIKPMFDIIVYTSES